MEKHELDEFLYYTQFQKKLPIFYFFLTKEFFIWIAVMYILHEILNPLFFALALLLSFVYVVRNYFSYTVSEKYQLFLFKKIKNLLVPKTEN